MGGDCPALPGPGQLGDGTEGLAGRLPGPGAGAVSRADLQDELVTVLGAPLRASVSPPARQPENRLPGLVFLWYLRAARRRQTSLRKDGFSQQRGSGGVTVWNLIKPGHLQRRSGTTEPPCGREAGSTCRPSPRPQNCSLQLTRSPGIREHSSVRNTALRCGSQSGPHLHPQHHVGAC